MIIQFWLTVNEKLENHFYLSIFRLLSVVKIEAGQVWQKKPLTDTKHTPQPVLTVGCSSQESSVGKILFPQDFFFQFAILGWAS